MHMTSRPLVYPFPRVLEPRSGCFRLDDTATIGLPESPAPDDLFLARALAAHLVDRRQLALGTVRGNDATSVTRQILMGDVRNPRVRAEADRLGLTPPAESPEGYVLDISATGILVAGTTARGAFYGMQSLRQILDAHPVASEIPAVRIRDWPYKPFRALRLYLPGTENLAFFRRFIRDFAAYFKYNALVLETNAAMRLERHPELNAGGYEFARCLNYTRRDRPRGPGGEFQDSAHHDTGDFGVVEKDDVAGIVRFATEHYMEVIPEIPFLTHSYYLLTCHRELAEIQAAEWPDTVCPQAPGAYELYFDVVDEYLEVMRPRTVHMGHDEWRMPVDVCPRCRGGDYAALFVDDVRRIYARLQAKGVRLALWGDHLVEAVYGGPRQEWTSAAGRKYPLPGSISPRQLEQDIPRDILILNWFWNTAKKPVNSRNDALLSSLGFEQVFGNVTPEILEQEYGRRSSQPGVLGGAVSSWSATTAYNFGKDLMYDFVGCAHLLWSDRWAPLAETAALVQAWMPVVRRSFRVASTPIEDGEAAVPVVGTVAPLSVTADLPAVRSGTLAAAGTTCVLASSGPLATAAVGTPASSGARPVEQAVAVGADVSSLVFLHACAGAAANHRGHTFIYNFPDTADLLGWYEITYDDEFVATVPVRYGVNILEWNWPGTADVKSTCVEADPVDVSVADSAPVTFFAHEWVNPRFGKVVRHVRLIGSRGFISANGSALGANAVVLLALTAVPRRPLSAQAWHPPARVADAGTQEGVTAGA